MSNQTSNQESANQDSVKPIAQGRINRRQNLPQYAPQNWWTTTSRRKVLIGGAAATAVVLAGGIFLASRDDTTDVDKDSLELQRTQGWNIGSEEKPLALSATTETDSLGGASWRDYLEPNRMLDAFQPRSEAWLPFFVPTLIQSLQFASLRTQLKPIFTADMQEAYLRGQAIGRDFLTNSENAAQTLIIADLPGRDAVAFGAGLAESARLITTFDNYPHPLGVTPSQETLAAMLYYAGEIETKQRGLAANAPAVLLLDANRLNDYKDADTQFDNRYLAKLPTAANLKERNVQAVLYATPDRARTVELDDLNEDFVAYKDANINVAMLPLSDFTPSNEASLITQNGGNNNNNNNQATNQTHYYYGGSPLNHFLFFSYYPFFSPYRTFGTRYAPYMGTGGGAVRGIGSGMGMGNRGTFSAPPRYAPAPRPTMFSASRVGAAASGGGGIGRAKPTGFGRSTVRVSPSRGVVGTRAGRSGFY